MTIGKKANRKGVHLFITESQNGEHQVREGNRIVSRHQTLESAKAALLSEQRARIGRHSVGAQQ